MPHVIYRDQVITFSDGTATKLSTRREYYNLDGTWNKERGTWFRKSSEAERVIQFLPKHPPSKVYLNFQHCKYPVRININKREWRLVSVGHGGEIPPDCYDPETGLITISTDFSDQGLKNERHP